MVGNAEYPAFADDFVKTFTVLKKLPGDIFLGAHGYYYGMHAKHDRLANACPHAGASLAHGIMDGDTVTCRIHHWRFTIRDGKYLDEDKPRCDVQTFAVRVVGEEVQVAVKVSG